MNIRNLSAAILFFCSTGAVVAQPVRNDGCDRIVNPHDTMAVGRSSASGNNPVTGRSHGATVVSNLGSVLHLADLKGVGGNSSPGAQLTISNPRFDGVGFRLDLSSIVPATVEVYDAAGTRIASSRTRGSRSVRVVPRGAVASGMYMLRVSGGGAWAVAKVAVVR